jgi:hypothetical protein
LESSGRIRLRTRPSWAKYFFLTSVLHHSHLLLVTANHPQVYLFVDWDKESFYLGRQKQRSDIAPALVPSKAGSCPNPGSEQQKLSSRDIGLISGLAVLGALVLGALGFVLWKRHPATTTQPPIPTDPRHDGDHAPAPLPDPALDGAAPAADDVPPRGQRLRDLFGR